MVGKGVAGHKGGGRFGGVCHILGQLIVLSDQTCQRLSQVVRNGFGGGRFEVGRFGGGRFEVGQQVPGNDFGGCDLRSDEFRSDDFGGRDVSLRGHGFRHDSLNGRLNRRLNRRCGQFYRCGREGRRGVLILGIGFDIGKAAADVGQNRRGNRGGGRDLRQNLRLGGAKA